MTHQTTTSETPNGIAKAQIYAKLARLGITTVLISYDGCGDSGCIESLEAYDPNGKTIQLPKREVTIDFEESQWDAATASFIRVGVKRKLPIAKAVESWCYDLIEQHFAGWELNEGSQGTIELDVAKNVATLEHDENVMTTTTHTVVA